MKQTIIYTDGASRGNPGPGGYGAIVAMPDKVIEIGGSERETTNNRMELMAPYEALKALSEVLAGELADEVVIYSDSTYVVKGITSWIHAWIKRDWKTLAGDHVEHQDLWEGLYELSRKIKPKWVILKGHSGIAGNERCDEIATAFADGNEVPLYSGDRGGYKVNLDIGKSSNSVAAAGSSSKAKSKSKASKAAYSYVSMVDGKISINKTWSECESLVKGKSGAKFKKVFSSAEEKLLVAEWTDK